MLKKKKGGFKLVLMPFSLLFIILILGFASADEPEKLSELFQTAEIQEQIEKNTGSIDVIVVLEAKEEKEDISKNNPENKTLTEIKEEVKQNNEETLPGIEGDGIIGEIETYETLNAISVTVTPEKLEELQENPDVKAIIPNINFNLFLEKSVPFINATKVHSTNISGQNITGKGMGVCVIDTGINASHPDLAGRIIAQQCFCDTDSDPSNGGCCPDGLAEQSNNANDENGHGTHISGTIIANSRLVENNNNLVGAAPEAGIVAVKVFGKDRTAQLADILFAMDFCISNKELYNISAISMSLGTDTLINSSQTCDNYVPVLTDVFNLAYSQDIVIAAASGNTGSTEGIALPACLSNATAVGSSNYEDSISAFTNRNLLLDVLAPGESINSTAQSNCPAGGVGQVCSITGYKVLSGTSMATPHISGVAALAQQYSILFQNRKLKAGEMMALFRHTGKTVYDGSTQLTFPRVDALEIINTISEPVKYSKFKNLNSTVQTTKFEDYSIEQLEQLRGAVIANTNGIISYPGKVNFIGANLNSSFSISPNKIIINLSMTPETPRSLNLNRTAIISIFNPGISNGIIFLNGGECTKCRIISSTVENITFNITDFAGYSEFTAVPEYNLELFDTADPKGENRNVTAEEKVGFYANFTRLGVPAGSSICNISILENGNASNSITGIMIFNETNGLYEFSAVLENSGGYTWNTACISNESAILSASDNITILPWEMGCKNFIVANKNYIFEETVLASALNMSIMRDNACIVIEAENISLDCNGHEIINKEAMINPNSTVNYTAILIKNTKNTMIKNCFIGNRSGTGNFSNAITLVNSSGAVINNTQNNGIILLSGSSGSTNIMFNSSYAIVMFEQNPANSSNLTLEVYWPAEISVKNSGGSQLNATLTITNFRNETIQKEALEGKAVFTAKEAVYSYAETKTYNPHRINAALDCYTPAETQQSITGSKEGVNAIEIIITQVPAVAGFDGETTNFAAVPDLSNTENITIEKQAYGKLKFIGPRDARGKDFTGTIKIGDGFVSLNTTALGGGYNNKTEVILRNISCSAFSNAGGLIYSSGFYSSAETIRATGKTCNENTTPACTNIICTNSTLSFATSNFSGFAAGANAVLNLSTNATNSSANSSLMANTSFKILIGYYNSSSLQGINNAVCILQVSNTSYEPSYNDGTSRYEYSLNLPEPGTYYYNASCDGVFFTKLTAESSFTLIKNNNTVSVNNTNLSTNQSSGGSSGSGSGGSSGGGGGGGAGGAGGNPVSNTQSTPSISYSSPSPVAASAGSIKSQISGESSATAGSSDSQAQSLPSADSQAGKGSGTENSAENSKGEASVYRGLLSGRLVGTGKLVAKTLRLLDKDGKINILSSVVYTLLFIGAFGSIWYFAYSKFNTAVSEKEVSKENLENSPIHGIKEKFANAKNRIIGKFRREYLFDKYDDLFYKKD